MVAALFAVTYGISTPLAAYGVFLPVLAETFGWSRGAISAAVSLNLILGGVAGFVVGALADRHGPRLLLVVTVTLATAGFMLVATVHSLWQLYLFVGVLAGVGMSGFYLLGASTVAHWFVARRGLALAVVFVGFNLGYITGGPLAAWLIEAVGWRHAYAWLAGGAGLVTLAAALSVGAAPARGRGGHAPRRLRRVPRLRAGRRARRHLARGTGGSAALVPQWILAAPGRAGPHGVRPHRALRAGPGHRPGGGITRAHHLWTRAALGRLTGGAFSDRLGPRTTIYVAYGLTAVALLALRWIPSREILLASVALFGAGFAATDTMVVKVVPDLFGMRAIGAIMGILTLGSALRGRAGSGGRGLSPRPHRLLRDRLRGGPLRRRRERGALRAGYVVVAGGGRSSRRA